MWGLILATGMLIVGMMYDITKYSIKRCRKLKAQKHNSKHQLSLRAKELLLSKDPLYIEALSEVGLDTESGVINKHRNPIGNVLKSNSTLAQDNLKLKKLLTAREYVQKLIIPWIFNLSTKGETRVSFLVSFDELDALINEKERVSLVIDCLKELYSDLKVDKKLKNDRPVIVIEW